ncbi:MAG: DNA cytosine methyltransferase [Bernardetiaceae bacterium]|jgi:DNA (cytosine-5)-methyltransferase 1|nr:DNA cytosine methyltransferase [Bernardetiaceae bacterium]
MTKQYNAISLFSGAMGLDLGLERAGLNVRTCVELNKLACRTIRANTAIPVIEDDINHVTADQLLATAGLAQRDLFLVAGGPPCQAFSTAGKRRSLDDFRGNVITNFLRVVAELAPPYFILENVRGILSAPLIFVPEEYEAEYQAIVSEKGSVVYFLQREFAKLGYHVSFGLFNSANYGVPQVRERVLMFGSRAGRIPLPSPTHSQTGLETGQPWVTLRQAFAGLDRCDHLPMTDRAARYLAQLAEGQNWRNLPPGLQQEAMGKSFGLAGGKTGFYRRLSFDRPSPTLVTSPTMPATMLCHPTELRPLSVQEYARIQQFPDHWQFQGRLLDIYRQIGNAVPVGLGYAAGRAVVEFHEGQYNPRREATNPVPYSRYSGYADFEFLPNFKKRVQQKEERLTSLFEYSTV